MIARTGTTTSDTLDAYRAEFTALRQQLHAEPETAYEETRTSALVAQALEPAVLSVTQFHGGEATNVIPSSVTLEGTARSYTKHAQAVLEAGIERLAAGTAASYGLEITVQYQHGYPATVNTPREAAFARSVLEGLVGQAHVLSLQPLMTAEDFSFMLQARPGAYIWVGNGDSAGLHTPRYNFNDDILTLGAAYWVRLVEAAL